MYSCAKVFLQFYLNTVLSLKYCNKLVASLQMTMPHVDVLYVICRYYVMNLSFGQIKMTK